MPDLDACYMRMAIELSWRAVGATAENPPVGCIIIKDGVAIGRGVTAKSGRPHAETVALTQAGENAYDATAYVTLEPCAHHGRTPPCCEALVEAGISRVVCAVRDPDHRVSGKGLEYLRQHNVDVVQDICAIEARRVLAGYLSRVVSNKPLVRLKLAISKDEMLATNDTDHPWITGKVARDRGHLMRAQCDAIIVGVGTVIDDNPDLTCRLKGLEDRSLIRVIVDTHLRTPLNSHLVESARKSPVIIACSQSVEIEPSMKFHEKGVEIIPCKVKSGRIDLADMLEKLADHGINRTLFEGGAKIAATLIEEQLIDELAIFTAPHKIGAKGTPAFVKSSLRKTIKQLSLVEDYKLNVGSDELNLYHRSEM